LVGLEGRNKNPADIEFVNLQQAKTNFLQVTAEQ